MQGGMLIVAMIVVGKIIRHGTCYSLCGDFSETKSSHAISHNSNSTCGTQILYEKPIII